MLFYCHSETFLAMIPRKVFESQFASALFLHSSQVPKEDLLPNYITALKEFVLTRFILKENLFRTKESHTLMPMREGTVL